ncbi:uncharacterized protein [Macaca nemestrina]|uniref:uncharacterized protein isoform X2 n=1 Tax=Macaca nemestrina TaxID=9545 RepID=UPI0039B9937D
MGPSGAAQRAALLWEARVAQKPTEGCREAREWQDAGPEPPPFGRQLRPGENSRAAPAVRHCGDMAHPLQLLAQVEAELELICGDMLEVLDIHLIPAATTAPIHWGEWKENN